MFETFNVDMDMGNVPKNTDFNFERVMLEIKIAFIKTKFNFLSLLLLWELNMCQMNERVCLLSCFGGELSLHKGAFEILLAH